MCFKQSIQIWGLRMKDSFNQKRSKRRRLKSTFLLSLRLESSHVVNTLGHTSTPIFSVSCRFFSLFPGHTNGLQVLAYDINPVLFRSSWFARDMVVHLPIQSFSILSFFVHSTWLSHPSVDEVHFFQISHFVIVKDNCSLSAFLRVY